MMDFLDLSATTGLLATVALTLNLLLGMLVGTAYKKHPYWKRLPLRLKQFRLFTLHNWTAYLALVFVLLHPLLLLLDASAKFTFVDLVFPLNAPHQKFFVALGTVAMFLIIIVVLSSQKAIRKKMSFRSWKAIHLFAYASALLFIVHGIVLDPLLKDRPIDFFDGEKLISVFCGLLLIMATVLRLRYHFRTKKSHSVK